MEMIYFDIASIGEHAAAIFLISSIEMRFCVKPSTKCTKYFPGFLPQHIDCSIGVITALRIHLCLFCKCLFLRNWVQPDIRTQMTYQMTYHMTYQMTDQMTDRIFSHVLICWATLWLIQWREETIWYWQTIDSKLCQGVQLRPYDMLTKPLTQGSFTFFVF